MVLGLHEGKARIFKGDPWNQHVQMECYCFQIIYPDWLDCQDHDLKGLDVDKVL